MKAHAARRANDHVARDRITGDPLARDKVARNLIHRLRQAR
jgi:hypothetical protein